MVPCKALTANRLLPQKQAGSHNPSVTPQGPHRKPPAAELSPVDWAVQRRALAVHKLQVRSVGGKGAEPDLGISSGPWYLFDV